jgi:hypothetical protein
MTSAATGHIRGGDAGRKADRTLGSHRLEGHVGQREPGPHRERENEDADRQQEEIAHREYSRSTDLLFHLRPIENLISETEDRDRRRGQKQAPDLPEKAPYHDHDTKDLDLTYRGSRTTSRDHRREHDEEDGSRRPVPDSRSLPARGGHRANELKDAFPIGRRNSRRPHQKDGEADASKHHDRKHDASLTIAEKLHEAFSRERRVVNWDGDGAAHHRRNVHDVHRQR